MAAGGIVLERHPDEDRLLRLPITYDNAINDPRTNAHTDFTGQSPFAWQAGAKPVADFLALGLIFYI
jgi:hypothetical protein